MNKIKYISFLLSNLLLFNTNLMAEDTSVVQTTSNGIDTTRKQISEYNAGYKILKNESIDQQKSAMNALNNEMGTDFVYGTPGGSSSNGSSASWSLMNKNCEIDPNLAFQDSMDRLQKMMGQIINSVVGNAKMWSMNKSIEESCDGVAMTACVLQGKYADYIDFDAETSEITTCMSKELKGVTKTSVSTETGVVYYGCGIMPGQGIAPPMPMFPFCANPTNQYSECNSHEPACSLRTAPAMNSKNGTDIDSQSLGAAAKCNKDVSDVYRNKAITICKDAMYKNCIKVINSQTNQGLGMGMMDLNMQNTSCKLKKQYIDASFEQDIKNQMEGKMLPNNKQIVNGVAVKFNPDEPDMAFLMNKQESSDMITNPIKQAVAEQLRKMSKRAPNGSKSAALEMNDLQKIQDEQKKLLDEYNLMLTMKDDMKLLDEHVQKGLNDIGNNFFNEPDYNIALLEIYKLYVNERKKILLAKYLGYRQYDLLFFTNYDGNLKNEVKAINNELAQYDEQFNIEYSKFNEIVQVLEDKESIYLKNINEKTDYSRITTH